MGIFNKLFGKKEIGNYTEKLATLIMENSWTKDYEQAVALADTLVLNMGYIKAEKYILEACHRYAQTTKKVLDIIGLVSDGEENIPRDIYYMTANILLNNVDDLMQHLISEIDDLTKLTFKWGDIKNIFIDEIKIEYPDFNDNTYDDVSEKLMEYLCFNVEVKNRK